MQPSCLLDAHSRGRPLRPLGTRISGGFPAPLVRCLTVLKMSVQTTGLMLSAGSPSGGPGFGGWPGRECLHDPPRQCNLGAPCLSRAFPSWQHFPRLGTRCWGCGVHLGVPWEGTPGSSPLAPWTPPQAPLLSLLCPFSVIIQSRKSS